MSELRPEIESVCRKAQGTPRFVGEVDDIAMLRLLALSGEGVVFIPKVGALEEIKRRTLRVVCEFPDLDQSFYAITRRGHRPAPEIENLIETFQKSLEDSKFFHE
jgi:LysR family transcriptional activator of nhaA